jgi:hypothetical protein
MFSSEISQQAHMLKACPSWWHYFGRWYHLLELCLAGGSGWVTGGVPLKVTSGLQSLHLYTLPHAPCPDGQPYLADHGMKPLKQQAKINLSSF